MTARQSSPASLPKLWLLSDQRNDAVLEEALRRLPRGSGFVFRHYHLSAEERRARFDSLGALCRDFGHWIILSGDAGTATAWGADGIYGPVEQLERREGLLRLATVHSATEIEIADRAEVDGVFLSPVFPTRSHPGDSHLGEAAFLALAGAAKAPVIALGGMTAERAAELDWPRWAAIDGLS